MGRVMGNDGGLVLVGAGHFLEYVAVVEDFGGVFVRKLEEVVEKAGICRINERGFPVVMQHFVDQSFCSLELFNQKIFVTTFFQYDWKFRSIFSSGSCQESFDVRLLHSWCCCLYSSNRSPLSENADLGSHKASVIGYPSHLMRYWYPRPRLLCFRIVST